MTTFEVHSVESSHELLDDDEITPDGMEEPIIHLFGYDTENNWHHQKVRGFEPYCYVKYRHKEWIARQDEVKRVQSRKEDGSKFESVRGKRLVRCYTYEISGPSDVSKYAQDEGKPIKQTWESDVFYTHRFIADMDLESGVEIPDDAGEYVHVDSICTCTCHPEWRVHYVDIEVNDRNGFPENGVEPIICITAYDSFDEEYNVWIWNRDDHTDADPSAFPTEASMHDAQVRTKKFADEQAMLNDYFTYLEETKPSVFTAWNVSFDLTYLWDRAKHLNEQQDADVIEWKKMSPLGRIRRSKYGNRIRGLVVFDLLDGLKSTQYTDMDSYRLEDVGQAFLGVGKEKYVGRVGDLWENSPVELAEYNIRDVELMTQLDEQQDLINFWREVSRIGRCDMEETTAESSVVDKYLLNVLHGDYVMPRKGSQPNVSGSYSGGAVFDAVNGLYKNVPLLDLASLYPMSMLTCNISPETKVDPDEFDGPTYVSPNGIHFRQDKEGITKRVIDNLLEKRNDKKAERDTHDPDSNRYKVLDNQQRALKVIMNSLYGVLAWNRFRLYDQDGARATTATGREVLAFTAEVCEDLGYEVLYGDTDSVLLNLDDSLDTDGVVEIGTEVEAVINERYDEFAKDQLNADRHFFDIELEKVYERFFQSGAKKRYAGRIRWKEEKEVDNIDITGYEYKRSDASELANESQEHVLRMICEDAESHEVAEYVHSKIREIQRGEVTLDEIGIPEGIGKPMDDYQSATHSVRAAKHGNLLLGTTFSSGSKPKRYYLEGMDDQFWYELEQEWADPKTQPFYAIARSGGYPRYLAVERAEQLPPECHIDFDIHERKCLKQSLSSITGALGLAWDELQKSSQQSALDQFAD